MQVVCAWCRQPISASVEAAGVGESAVDEAASDAAEALGQGDATDVSHGICEGCLPGVAKECGIPMSEFLESLGPPAIIVQRDRRVLAANAAAQALISKNHNEITGQLGGYALGCVHADDPNCCGQKVHCVSCTIRKTVMHTVATGEPLTDVQASPELSIFTGKHAAQFLISSEKVSDFVVVTIRNVEGVQPVPEDVLVG